MCDGRRRSGSSWYSGGRPALADSASQRTARQHFHQGEAYYTAGSTPRPWPNTRPATMPRRCRDSWSTSPSASVAWVTCNGRAPATENSCWWLPIRRWHRRCGDLIQELDRLIAETATAARTPAGGGAAPPRPAPISGRRLAMSFDSNGVLPFESADDPAEHGAHDHRSGGGSAVRRPWPRRPGMARRTSRTAAPPAAAHITGGCGARWPRWPRAPSRWR